MTQQIASAEGWYALYLLKENPFHSLVHVVCWMLDERATNESRVVGMVVDTSGMTIAPADSIEGFRMYVHRDRVNEGDLHPIIGEHRSKMLAEDPQ